MKQYLDTSSIRILGSRTQEIEDSGSYSTSAVCLIELAGQLRASDTEFRQRQKWIASVLLSSVNIDWATPEEKLTLAFGLQASSADSRRESLKRIMKAAAISANRGEFIRAEDALDVSPHIGYWEGYGEELAAVWTSAVRVGSRCIWNAFTRQGKMDNRSVLIREVFGRSAPGATHATEESVFPVQVEATERAIAAMVLTCAGMPSADAEIDRVWGGRNRSLSVFARAHAAAMLPHLRTIDPPGPNDVIELTHFLYVNEDTLIISANTRLARLARAIGVRVAGPGGIGA